MTVPATNPNTTRVVEPKRVFTPPRIVALALIGLVVLGLAYLRFEPDGRSPSLRGRTPAT